MHLSSSEEDKKSVGRVSQSCPSRVKQVFNGWRRWTTGDPLNGCAIQWRQLGMSIKSRVCEGVWETIHHHCNSGSWLDLEQRFRCGVVWSGFNCMLKSHVQCRRTWIRYSLHDPLVLSVVVFVVMGPHCSCSQNVFISIRNIMWNSFLYTYIGDSIRWISRSHSLSWAN